MTGGSAEMLLLSNLTPRRIVLGKLLCSGVQIVLWESLFAPLVGLTFLLRGVSVVQIAAALAMLTMLGVALSALGIAIGSLAAFRRVQGLVAVLGTIALIVSAFSSSSWVGVGMARMAWSGEETVQVLGSMLVALIAAAALFLMIAASQFTHPFENRSTGFRLLLVILTIVGMGWTAAAFPVSDLDDALPGVAFALLLFGSVFMLFAATEEAALSPRVRTHVPARRDRALLAAFFLPGGGRGILWSATWALFVLVLPLVLLKLLGSSEKPDASTHTASTAMAEYGLLYAALGALIRSRLRPGPWGSWVARTIVVGVVVIGCALPILLQVLLGFGTDWSVLQILNPFWTISVIDRHPAGEVFLGSITVLVVILCIPAMGAGLREVFEASRRRESRAA